MPTPTNQPKPETKPTVTKTVSPAILAARAFNRIETLVKQRNAELKDAPQSIYARYAKKIGEASETLDDEAAGLLNGMLEKSGLLASE